MAKRKPLTDAAGESRVLRSEDVARSVPSSALPEQDRAMLSSRKAAQKVPGKKCPNRAREAILEMAEDQLRSGLMTQTEHDKIILRHSGPQAHAPKKAPRKKPRSRLTAALLETAEDMHRIGVMDDATYQEITLRHLGPHAPGAAKPSSGGVKGLRIKKKL